MFDMGGTYTEYSIETHEIFIKKNSTVHLEY